MRGVASVFGVGKRLLVGRPMRSGRLGHTLLPKKIALPVFASDALSSVADATEEILLVLSAGGLALLRYTPYVALGVGVLMLVVVASYRQNVHAYPSGGGDYEIAATNLGLRVGLAVASALMVDYTLTVAISKLHLPTLRALAYARATRPSHLEAVTIDVDEHETAALEREWDRLAIQLPLTVVASPYREITRPVIEYVKRVRRESPRDIVTVYIPQYVPDHWWEQLLHNQSALRLKSRLLYLPGVIVATVPDQMRSTAARTASGTHAGSSGQFDVPPADRRDHAS
jgi:hypothetical protein